MSTLANAIALAAEAFKNKKDKAGEPYIMHCIRVMIGLYTTDEEKNIIAILHDYIEDIFKDNYEEGFKYLRALGYSERMMKALDLLTHRNNIPYMAYIKHLSYNEDAKDVKISDLKDNSNITRLKGLRQKDFDRMEKYHTAYIYLNSCVLN